MTELITDATGGLQLEPHEPFIAAGIKSAQSARIAMDVSKELGLVMSPVDMFNHPTVHSLAEFLAGKDNAAKLCVHSMTQRTDELQNLETKIAKLAAEVTETQVTPETQLTMNTRQVKQFAIMLAQRLDVWVTLVQLEQLSTALVIAEHVEGGYSSERIACIHALTVLHTARTCSPITNNK